VCVCVFVTHSFMLYIKMQKAYDSEVKYFTYCNKPPATVSCDHINICM